MNLNLILSILNHLPFFRFDFTFTLGFLQISPEDSPLKSANENSTDEKICPPNEMQTEVLAYRSIIESPKFPSSPIDGIIPSVVKSPGSGASNILEQEFRKERTTSDQEQKVSEYFTIKV